MNRRTFLRITPAMALLAACSKSSKTRLALNWKPEPEFGGFYAAPFSDHGLDVEILPGGAGTPTVQMIGAGSAEFGIVEADEIVVARANGNPVVALFAVYQNSPMGIMVHADRKADSLEDVLKGGTLAVQEGLPFVRLLKKKYGLDHVKIVPSPSGDLAAFRSDPNFAQQVFVTSEPLAAKRQGIPVTVFPISDSGYNPYADVLATSEEMLNKHLEVVKSMVAAVRQGWRKYLDDPQPADEKMHELNPSMDSATFAAVAEAQKPLIETADTRGHSLGWMDAQRWATLIGQLKEIGDIPKDVPAADCFRNL